MNKSDLEKIVAISETGSMAKAAKKLFITQPALSKCLTRVEVELGETLFTRRPNGLIITFAGKCFIKSAYQILKLYDNVNIEFCDLNQMRKGVLKLGAVERVGSLVLPNLLKKFKELYPNITIDIMEAPSHLLEEKLLMGIIDIAIVCMPLKNDNINYRIFHEEPFYIALPYNHPLNKKAKKVKGEKIPYLDLQELRGTNLILTANLKKTRQGADRILKYLDNDYNVSMEFKNIETVIRLVANGLGISIIPSVYSKVYKTGKYIKYYQIDKKYNPTWQWAVIYNEGLGHLTRPSKELLNIIIKNGFILPDYL